jgi:biopolymer transport protein ExbB/TolQ
MVVLSIFFIYALINMGILLAEYYRRRKTKFDIKNFISQLLSLKGQNPDEMIKVIEAGEIPRSQKDVLITLVKSSNMSPEYRESLAIKMVEDESIWASKKLERTDIIAKIAPAIGLMGTLIPLGPGLTALGSGDIQSLAQHLLIAFDAAVLGMASAAIAFVTSKIKRRWYEEEISNLETMVDTILEIQNA